MTLPSINIDQNAPPRPAMPPPGEPPPARINCWLRYAFNSIFKQYVGRGLDN